MSIQNKSFNISERDIIFLKHTIKLFKTFLENIITTVYYDLIKS